MMSVNDILLLDILKLGCLGPLPENREALKKVRNQKALINDIDTYAWKTGNNAGGTLILQWKILMC